MGTTREARELAALLRACRDDPDDDTPRLVLADWLDERGHPRAELVRVQVERDHPRLPPERHAVLVRREADLLRLREWEWSKPLADQVADVGCRRGLHSVALYAGDEGIVPAGPAGADWDWVDAVTVRRADAIVPALSNPRCAGVTRFRFEEFRAGDGSDAAFTALARSPAASRLTALEVSGGRAGSTALLALLGSPRLARLGRLSLDFTSVTAAGLEPLAELDHPSLRVFRLYGADLGPAGGRLLAAAPLLARLRRLELIVTHLGTEGFLAVFGSPHLERLEHLHFSSERMTVGGVRALGRLPALRELALRECEIKAPAARALAGAPWPGRLAVLDLYRNHLDDEAVGALTAAPWFAGLRELNLGHNRLGAGSAARLAASGLAGLTRLDLSSNGLNVRALAPWLERQSLLALNLAGTFPGADGVRALADCTGLDCLTDLNLSADVGRADGARALARAPWLRGVVRLDLFATRIGADGLRALLASGGLEGVADLGLRLCLLGDAGARLLADWPGLAGLRRLDLSANDIGNEGALALDNSPHLPPGLRLGLAQNLITLHPAGMNLDARLGRGVDWRGDGVAAAGE